jgi:A/G-specific adenine glycosylase
MINFSDEFSKNILNWFARCQRNLPWRKDVSDYSSFISEFMLQQTQVKTVIPYYNRFIEKLPNWKSLAFASEKTVLKLWEGLGYYRRVKNLKKSAEIIVQHYNGKLPDQFDEIHKLPGVGHYTAGALLSIVYKKPYPAVDGNVIRVFSRIFEIKNPAKSTSLTQEVWKRASEMLPPYDPGNFNQALMELGALICIPKNPRCLVCPVQKHCQSFHHGTQSLFPSTTVKKKLVPTYMISVLLKQSNRILLRKISNQASWFQSLWEFPTYTDKNFKRAIAKAEKDLDVQIDRNELLLLKFYITKHKVTLKLFNADFHNPVIFKKDYRWIPMKSLAQYPLAKAQNQIRDFILHTFQKIQKKILKRKK